jgi:TonB family protein
MRRARWIAVSIVLPLLYAALVFVATRHPKPVYAFADPTVMTVTDKPGPAVYHAPEPIYPPEALRRRLEGAVRFQVTVAADGTVARATLVDGSAPLVSAALAAVRQYQFEARAAETEIDIGFSLAGPTRSRSPAEPVERKPPRGHGMRGVVRVVATVNPEGRVDFVQPVSGPDLLKPAVADAVRQWLFRPARRNGRPTRSTVVLDVPVGQPGQSEPRP